MNAFAAAAPLLALVSLIIMLIVARQHRTPIVLAIVAMTFLTGGFAHLIASITAL